MILSLEKLEWCRALQSRRALICCIWIVINGVKHIIRQWMSCCRQVLSRCYLAGRQSIFLPGQHPDESGAAIFESAGGHFIVWINMFLGQKHKGTK